MSLKNKLLSESLESALIESNTNFGKRLVFFNDINYKSIDRNFTLKDSFISFCPKGKETVLSNCAEFWSKENRQNIKIGRGLKRIVKNLGMQYVTDVQVEELTNKLKAFSGLGSFRTVKGSNIKDWYHEDTYHDKSGTLNDSCMRYSSCQSYFDIYTSNKECQLLILINDNELLGRALLWKHESGMYLDRIYGTDATIERFKRYAKTHGFNHKKRQSFEDKTTWVSPNGKDFEKTFKIHLDAQFSEYPYMDTFSFTDKYGYISNNNEHGEYELNDTDGASEENENRFLCCVNCDYYDEDDMRFIDSIGEWCHFDNCVYSSSNDCYYLTDDATELHDGTWVHNDDAYECTETGEYYKEEDVYILQDGNYCHHEHCSECFHDGEFYLNNEMVFLNEIQETVHENNVNDCYEENGYRYDDDTDTWTDEPEDDDEEEENELLTQTA